MNQEIVVIGAGGHAKVCIELLRAMGETVSWCVGGADSAETCLGVPVLKGDDHIPRLREAGFGRVFVAIGANKLRVRLAGAAVDLGYTLASAVSPAATISPTAVLGDGVAIMAGVVINADARIGDCAIVNTGATVDHDCVIGKGVHLAPQCALAGNVIVGEGAFLGIGTRVIPERTVGAGSLTGAGSVVIKDIEAGVTAVGAPARTIKQHS